MRQVIPALSPEERREKHRIFWRDAGALGTLSLIVIVGSFITYGLFHSFDAHRDMLERRWQQRGEAALAANQPMVAVNDLHSALAYTPDDRQLQIDLAMALAAAGRLREAQAYFTTLLEQQPGSGIINLQLARLLVRENNIDSAIDHYQAAIDGTWYGDGYTRRRAVRLELARMLIDQQRLAPAREQLLIAAGNAPNDYPLQIQVGNQLLAAGDPSDAQDLFAKAAKSRATRVAGLLGEAQAAEALSRYAVVKYVLTEAQADSNFAHQPKATRDSVDALRSEAESILALDPLPTLPRWLLAQRVAKLAGMAQARLANCPAAPAVTAAAAKQQQKLLTGLAAHLQDLNPLKRFNGGPPPAAPTQAPGTASSKASSTTAEAQAVPTASGNAPQKADAAPTTPPSAQDSLPSLAERWAQIPVGNAFVQQLANDPDFAQSTLDLTYATTLATADKCGAPKGDDALLLKIAKAPAQVDAP